MPQLMGEERNKLEAQNYFPLVCSGPVGSAQLPDNCPRPLVFLVLLCCSSTVVRLRGNVVVDKDTQHALIVIQSHKKQKLLFSATTLMPLHNCGLL